MAEGRTTYAERLSRLLFWLCWLAIIVIAVVLARDAATGHLPWQTHIDPRTGTAGLAVETDAGTGCDYIVTPWGGIMPRTGGDGKQVCHQNPP